MNESSSDGPYAVVFPIALFALNKRVLIVPAGLARDIESQLKFEPNLRVIALSAKSRARVPDGVEFPVDTFPNFTYRLLPWSGDVKTFWLKWPFLRRILNAEARQSSVWHTCCGLSRWDITTETYAAGRAHARGRKVLGLDSDPAAMLRSSGRRRTASFIERRYKRWAAEVDLTIMMGQGVWETYSPFARRAVLTNAVWIGKADLADVDEVRQKFRDLSVVRLVLPSRMTAWKGVDDVINAFNAVGGELPEWQLDVMGDGEEKGRLRELAAGNPRITFIDSVPYGKEFFQRIRSYHVLIAPTRALEEARVVYDAAASGCALLTSATATLEAALQTLPTRWSFEAGNVSSLSSALKRMFAEQTLWSQAGLEGLEWSRNRSIDEMHAARAVALNQLRADAAPIIGA